MAFYTDQDMAVLQRIVSLRYLNFSLPQIQSVLQMERALGYVEREIRLK